MTTTTTQEFTLHLPEDVVERLRQVAMERHETTDQIVERALRFSLSPVRQEALRRLQGQVRKQRLQPEADIRLHLESQISTEEQQRLSELLEQNRAAGLTPEEENEMQQLFDRIEAVATEKAAAIWLLSGQPSEVDTS